MARVARASAFAVTAVLSVAGMASAGENPFGDTVVTITASQVIDGQTVSGSATFGLASSDYGYGEWVNNGQVYNWNMINGPVMITSATGVPLGRINILALAYDVDPAVAANFNLTAGALNTTFTVTSSNLIVAPGNYLGQASAGVTLTDNDGDGAAMGLASNPFGLYAAKYNGASVFANLLTPMAALPFDGNNQNGNTGAFAPNGFVTDISAEFNFTLSPNDTATGTSTYTIIPAPGSVALLGLGGLVAIRRRR